MSGTAAGAAKTRAKNLAKNPNYYRELGHLGGSAPKTRPGGFASMTPEKRREAGRTGGTVSRRGPSKTTYNEKVLWEKQLNSTSTGSTTNTTSENLTAKCRACLFVKRDINSNGLCPPCASLDDAVDANLVALIEEREAIDRGEKPNRYETVEVVVPRKPWWKLGL